MMWSMIIEGYNIRVNAINNDQLWSYIKTS